MIEFVNINDSAPYKEFKKLYDIAYNKKQDYIEAMCISSYNIDKGEISSRFVNLKCIKKKEFYFFSNYSSPKSIDFKNHPQINATFFWNKTNTQIRIKAKIYKADEDFSDEHFRKRSIEKNALAISSEQSKHINSYNEVIQKYESELELLRNKDSFERPDYWGGFYFIPYYFEFWIGNEFRINQRKEFVLEENKWMENILQP